MIEYGLTAASVATIAWSWAKSKVHTSPDAVKEAEREVERRKAAADSCAREIFSANVRLHNLDKREIEIVSVECSKVDLTFTKILG